MSRIAKQSITITDKVKIEYTSQFFKASGPLGEMIHAIPTPLDLEINENQIKVIANMNIKKERAIAGTTAKLISNIIQGVSIGFEKKSVFMSRYGSIMHNL